MDKIKELCNKEFKKCKEIFLLVIFPTKTFRVQLPPLPTLCVCVFTKKKKLFCDLFNRDI